MKSVKFESFNFNAGSDSTGVATEMASVNCTLKFIYRTTASFFGVHVTTSPIDLSYSEITLATGNVAGKINKIVRESGLKDLGQLEQDIVFGDAGTKEIINFLRTKEDISRENKLRLLMIYVAAYPEKFEGEKGSKLMQKYVPLVIVKWSALLSPDDILAIRNIKLLEGLPETKKSSSAFSLKFDLHKKKHAAGEEAQ